MDAHPDRYIDSKKAPADVLKGEAFKPKKFKDTPRKSEAATENSPPRYKVSKPV